MAKEPKEQGSKAATQEQKLICGIVIPISPMRDFPLNHWGDVQRILEDAITRAGFFPRVVSTSNVPTIIHKDIVQNLYSDPVVVCDVSGGNPNVMLEVGMRLAFDKPTIIVKDEQTKFNFDTQPLRQLEYPRDLRHGRIEEFKANLSQMIVATVEASESPGYTSFLKSFGPFKVPKLEEVELPIADYRFQKLEERLESIQNALNNRSTSAPDFSTVFENPQLSLSELVQEFIIESISGREAEELAMTFGARIEPLGTDSWRFFVQRGISRAEVHRILRYRTGNFRVRFFRSDDLH